MKNLVISTLAIFAAIALIPFSLTAKTSVHSATHSSAKSKSHSDAPHFTAKVKFIEVNEDKDAPHDLDALSEIKGAYLLTAPLATARDGLGATTQVTAPFNVRSHLDHYSFPANKIGVAFEIAAHRVDDRTQYAIRTTASQAERVSKSESGPTTSEVTSRDYYSTGSVASGHALWLTYKNPFLHKKLIVYVKFSWAETDREKTSSHKHSSASTKKNKSHHN